MNFPWFSPDTLLWSITVDGKDFVGVALEDSF